MSLPTVTSSLVDELVESFTGFSKQVCHGRYIEVEVMLSSGRVIDRNLSKYADRWSVLSKNHA